MKKTNDTLTTPTVAGSLTSKEAIQVFLTQLRIEGYSSIASKLGVKESELRKEIREKVNVILSDGRVCKTEVVAKWSLFDWSTKKNWIPKKQNGYVAPKVIDEIVDLLDMFFLELGLLTCSEVNGDLVRKNIQVLVEDYLEIAQAQAETSIRGNNDDHACIHILEIVTTFNMTVIQVLEAVLGYPNKMESESKPAVVEFYCHPLLGGLTVSDYVFNATDKKKIAQKPRSPSCKTNRVGQGISFEELANIYRTSRVTLANSFNKTLTDFKRKLKGKEVEYKQMLEQERCTNY